MDQPVTINIVGPAIQLSVAPVFLLSGIGAMLAVMTNRLSRVVDRSRLVESRLQAAIPSELPSLNQELDALLQRARLINRAITLCTITALFVCAVVASLFIGAYFQVAVAVPVAGFFVGAMLMFIAGLLFFLREIFVATATFRIERR